MKVLGDKKPSNKRIIMKLKYLNKKDQKVKCHANSKVMLK